VIAIEQCNPPQQPQTVAWLVTSLQAQTPAVIFRSPDPTLASQLRLVWLNDSELEVDVPEGSRLEAVQSEVNGIKVVYVQLWGTTFP
jgi:hypothetical protein